MKVPFSIRDLRLPRFSLKTLFVIYFAISVLVGWITLCLRENKRQADAVKYVHDHGGTVEYSAGTYYFPEVGPFDDSQSKSPTAISIIDYARVQDVTQVEFWFASWIPLDKVPALDYVELGQHLEHMPRLKSLRMEVDESVRLASIHLETLKQLKSLHLRCEQLTPEDVSALEKLPRLEHLNLDNTPFDVDSLNFQQKLTNLRELAIDCRQERSEALPHIAALRNLKSLAVTLDISKAKCLEALSPLNLEELTVIQNFRHDGRSTSVPADDCYELSTLRTIRSLRKLRLDKMTVYPKDMLALSQLANVEELTFNFVTPKQCDWKPLCSLKQLRTLTFDHCQLQDSDLQYLASLKSLKHVNLEQGSDRKYTLSGLNAMLDELPELQIICEGETFGPRNVE